MLIARKKSKSRFCPDDRSPETWVDRYADGRAVVSWVNVGDRSYVRSWHPDKSNEMNRPGPANVITDANGTRKQVIVSAPGHLDTITLADAGAAGDGQPALAQTE